MKLKNELAQKAHATALEKGFYDAKPTDTHILMMLLTEVTELIQADRKGRKADAETFELCKEYAPEMNFDLYMKGTKEDEFADIAIRLLDYAGYIGVDFTKFKNKNVPPTPVRNLTELAFLFTDKVTDATRRSDKKMFVYELMIMIERWADIEKIDLYYHIEQKMKYNKNRGRLHNNKY